MVRVPLKLSICTAFLFVHALLYVVHFNKSSCIILNADVFSSTLFRGCAHFEIYPYINCNQEISNQTYCSISLAERESGTVRVLQDFGDILPNSAFFLLSADQFGCGTLLQCE